MYDSSDANAKAKVQRPLPVTTDEKLAIMGDLVCMIEGRARLGIWAECLGGLAGNHLASSPPAPYGHNLSTNG